jgi:hypothetical protein
MVAAEIGNLVRQKEIIQYRSAFHLECRRSGDYWRRPSSRETEDNASANGASNYY